MFNFLFLNSSFCKISLDNSPTPVFDFKLKTEDVFVNGLNSRGMRLLRKPTVVDTLFLKSPTFCDSEISYPSCLKTQLFLKSLRILMNRYKNGECYIPSRGMVFVLKIIIDFAFKCNKNDSESTKFYLAALLGNIFHGTDFLSNLGPQKDCNSEGLFYETGRGIIQIWGLESYQLVTSLSSTTNYVRTPGALAFYTKEATEDSLKAYNKLCGDFQQKKNKKEGMTFYNTMEALKLDSLFVKKNSGNFSEDILKRMEIYKRICLVFGISTFVGEPL